MPLTKEEREVVRRNEVKAKAATDPDWINCKRFNNSIELLVERYNGATPDHIAAEVLGLTEEEYDAIYIRIVEKLRKSMKVEISV